MADAAPIAAVEDVGVQVKAHKTPGASGASGKSGAASYKVLCCGNSARDLVLIPLALLLVYALTAILFVLCTRAVLQTDDTSTALWMFFAIYVAFILMLGIVLGVTSYEKKMKDKHAGDASEDA